MAGCGSDPAQNTVYQSGCGGMVGSGGSSSGSSGSSGTTGGGGAGGGSGSMTFPGIYQVSSYSKNPEGCTAEGPLALDTLKEKYLVAFEGGGSTNVSLYLATCGSVENCRSKSKAGGTQGLAADLVWSLTMSSPTASMAADQDVHTSSLGNYCSGEVIKTTATKQPDGGIRVEVKTAEAGPFSLGSGGGPPATCTEGAVLSYGSNCDRLDVLTASFVEPL